MLFPAKFLVGILLYFSSASPFRCSNVSTTLEELQQLDLDSNKKVLKDHIMQRATDRRRGVIEDIHLGTKIFIEDVFDVVHKATHCLLSPLETFKRLLSWFSSNTSQEIPNDAPNVSIPTATLGETDPTLEGRTVSLRDSLNTDGRTCRDVITELGRISKRSLLPMEKEIQLINCFLKLKHLMVRLDLSGDMSKLRRRKKRIVDMKTTLCTS